MSRDHTAVVDVGTSPPDFHGWTSTEVRFHWFEDLPSEEDQDVVSPEFMCLGNRWAVKIFPGGSGQSEEGMVGIYLKNMSDKSINMKMGFRIKDFGDNEVAHKVYPAHMFGPKNGEHSTAGTKDFIERAEILDSLIDGSLVLEVSMRLIGAGTSAPFVPENPFCSNMLSSFLDEESADIAFEVCQKEGESVSRAIKKAKISPSIFHAHRLILQKCAPQLAELCVSGDNHSSPIQIPDVSPRIFRHLLYYVYGGKLSDDEMKANAKDIIEAADRYGVSTLKLEAEACYVQSTTFSVDNVLEILLFADSKNCALLKEAAMNFMVDNSAEVMEKVSFAHFPPTMMTDVFAAVTRGRKKSGEHNGNDFSTMCISELRRKVHERGLDVDGSREALVASLKENR